MLSYQALDTIADAYTPLLLLIVIINMIYIGHQKEVANASRRLQQIALGLLIAYGLMILDNYLGLWPAVGLDYSTHTAVALVLVVYLCYSLRGMTVYWLSSIVLYFLLMLYQGYHTLLDIISTTAIVGGLYVPLISLLLNPSEKSVDNAG